MWYLKGFFAFICDVENSRDLISLATEAKQIHKVIWRGIARFYKQQNGGPFTHKESNPKKVLVLKQTHSPRNVCFFFYNVLKVLLCILFILRI